MAKKLEVTVTFRGEITFTLEGEPAEGLDELLQACPNGTDVLDLLDPWSSACKIVEEAEITDEDGNWWDVEHGEQVSFHESFKDPWGNDDPFAPFYIPVPKYSPMRNPYKVKPMIQGSGWKFSK